MRDRIRNSYMRWGSYATMAAIALQLLLFVASWLVTAARPESHVHSLLGSEGIRWFCGSFVDNVASPPLVWLLVAAIAWGTLRECGIFTLFRRRSGSITYRQRFALRTVAIVALAMMAVATLLALVPDAPLRSVTGQLFPSSFSRCALPLAALAVTILAATYGLLSGHFRNATHLYAAMANGIAKAAPIILLYVVTTQLVCSLIYVVGA